MVKRETLKFLFFAILLFGFFSCADHRDNIDEYQEIREAASKLTGAKVYIIDTSASQMHWRMVNGENKIFSGTFFPEKGSVVVEKGLLVAGFWSGDLWRRSKLDPTMLADAALLQQVLLDSTPILKTASAKSMRLDMEQINRQIIRSDYHNAFNPGIDTSATHLIQASLTLSDSTLSVAIPVKLKIKSERVEITGIYNLNLPDFGIKYNRLNAEGKNRWQGSFPVSFRLVFVLK
jgi:hypothetical protein